MPEPLPTVRERRLRPRDLLFLVAVIALPLSVIGSTVRSTRDADEKLRIIVATIMSILCVGLLWAVLRRTGPSERKGWEGLFLLLFTLLVYATIFFLLVIYVYDPVAAALVTAALFGLLGLPDLLDGVAPGRRGR